MQPQKGSAAHRKQAEHVQWQELGASFPGHPVLLLQGKSCSAHGMRRSSPIPWACTTEPAKVQNVSDMSLTVTAPLETRTHIFRCCKPDCKSTNATMWGWWPSCLFLPVWAGKSKRDDECIGLIHFTVICFTQSKMGVHEQTAHESLIRNLRYEKSWGLLVEARTVNVWDAGCGQCCPLNDSWFSSWKPYRIKLNDTRNMCIFSLL